jgi:apolipoprotein N-acyltransferase
MDWYKTVFGIPTLIGLMIGSGFVIPAFWLVSIAGVAWCIDYCMQQSSWRVGLGVAVWIWTVKALITTSFFTSAYPIDWLGSSLGPLEPLIIFFYWSTVSLWLGIGGVGLYAGIYIAKRVSIWWSYVVLPVFWILGELLGALSFSFFTYGPGGSLTTQFSFGYIGYVLAAHGWLIELAHVYGVFGLSLVAILLAVAARQFWGNKRWLVIVAIVLLLITSTLRFNTKDIPNTDFYRVATIDTSSPTADRFSERGRVALEQQLTMAFDAALAAEVDYIIFPEDTRYFDQQDMDVLRAYMTFQYGVTDTIIIDSSRVQQSEQTVLQAIAYDGKSKDLYESQKRYLVPQGEFLPYFYQGVLQLVGYDAAIDFLQESLSYQVGDDTSQADFSERIPGILFCFESIDPLGVRTIMKERNGNVPFVAHVVSHAWFHTPDGLWQQAESMLRIQAIWNDIHIVSAGNHMPGYTVSPAGEVLHPTVVDQGEYWKLNVIEIPVR